MSNRLAYEDSPYLQQHKNNPLDWYPWCDDAFERARMEREVFENEEIAAFVNQHFVCIKVDREERPDIDKHYQELHMLLNRRSGGWPLSVFCTPENKPFYATTYIPPYTRERIMGFYELAEIIAQKVAENDDALFRNAEEISGFLRPANDPVQATVLNESVIPRYIEQARHNYDETNGGFSREPKFPHASTLSTLLLIDRLRPDPGTRAILTHTLDQMALGGMYDLIDGGFCRYSTDEKWLVPHFEKMTYDNALLCSLYATAGTLYHEKRYLEIACECADFMLRFMSEDDLFYSASDADTEGEEGKYFVYTYGEVVDALARCGVSDPQSAAAQVGAVPEGNFDGHCIVRFPSPERPEWFAPFREELRRLRRDRAYPFIDRKVITAWNAMMIRALFVVGRSEPRYIPSAEKSLNALLSLMGGGTTLKHSALIHKEAKIDAFLEDYAYLCAALIEGYQTTLEERWLIEAQRLANKALELFFEEGKWYFSRGAFTTPAELDDGTYPSSMAVMVESLLSLGLLVDPKYRRFAFKTLEYTSLKAMKTPIHYPTLTAQIVRWISGERLVKGKSERLRKLTKPFSHPFVWFKNDESLGHYLVCGENACFATADNAADLDSLITSTL